MATRLKIVVSPVRIWVSPSPESRDRREATSSVPGLFEMFEVDRRQVPDLILSQVDAHAIVDSYHGADRNRHLLGSPQMPLLEQEVGHVTVRGIDDQAANVSDRTVGGVDVLAAADLDLTHGHAVPLRHLPLVAASHPRTLSQGTHPHAAKSAHTAHRA